MIYIMTNHVSVSENILGFSGTCIKDTCRKPKAGRIKGGKWRWLG